MADFYVAPSYRGYSILRGPYTKDRKEYAIIDFKGKEKEIRIYRQPQKSWKEPAPTKSAPAVDPTSKPHYEEVDGCMRAVGLKDATLASLIGFGEQGYIDIVVLKDGSARSEFWKYTSINGLYPFRHNRMIGVYLPEGTECPKDVNLSFARATKSDLLIDDNTWRPREEVMNRLWELGGDTPELVTYKWEFTSKEALEKWKENKK